MTTDRRHKDLGPMKGDGSIIRWRVPSYVTDEEFVKRALPHVNREFDRRARKPEPKQQPDWEGLCRGLVSQIYNSTWRYSPSAHSSWLRAVSSLQQSPAATAARDAVRTQEPDERVGPKDRRLPATPKRPCRRTDRALNIHDAVFYGPTDRRQRRGTRADREGGA